MGLGLAKISFLFIKLFQARCEGSGVVRVVALECHQRKIMTAPPFPLSVVSTLFLEPVTLILMSGREDVNRENNFLFYLGASPKIMTK